MANLSPVQKARKHNSDVARNRRSIAAWSVAGLLDFIPISLFQIGVIGHLPDLPGKLFDSDAVNSSKNAQLAGIPDGPVSLAMYGGNLALLAAASRKKSRGALDYLVIAGVIGQAIGGANYLYKMAVEEKKICPYCVVGALINFATLIPAVSLLKGKK